MTRESWVYPRNGGDPIKKGEYRAQEAVGGVTILPDQPDFVSPIDGKLYSGRTGMRDHNARHNVVSNRDLAGLPTLTGQSDQRSSSDIRRDKAARKEQIIHLVNRHYK
jgi:hypothetical protein